MKLIARAAFAAAATFVFCVDANAETVGNASHIIPNASQVPPTGTRSDLKLSEGKCAPDLTFGLGWAVLLMTVGPSPAGGETCANLKGKA